MAFGKKKGFSAKGSRRIARQMDDSVIGTHVAKHGRTRAVSDPQTMGLSDFKKSRKADRGMVDIVTPKTKSRESDAAYSRRMSNKGLSEEARTKSKRKRIGIGIIAAIIVLLIGVGVGVFVFMTGTSGKLAIHDDTVKGTLVPQVADEPYYVLFNADLNAYDGSNSNIDAVILARIDEPAQRVVLLSFPANLQVRLSDGAQHALADAKEVGGAGELITAVSTLTGIDISHYIETDASGMTALVDRLGGLVMTLDEEVDDPQAGDVYLPAGEQTLDANAVITLMRARNFTESVITQANNRCEVVGSLLVKACSEETSAASLLDAIAEGFATDLSSGDCISRMNALKGMPPASILYGHVPGYEVPRGTTTFFVPDTDKLETVVSLMKAGNEPVIRDDYGPVEVDKSSFTIEVRNGSGIDGGAGMLADILRGAGYNVTKTGNADAYVYSETLVIYRDPDMLAAANAVLDTLRTGRVVDAGAFYVFEDDLLVVLGSDWKVVN